MAGVPLPSLLREFHTSTARSTLQPGVGADGRPFIKARVAWRLEGVCAEGVKAHIRRLAGEPDLATANETAKIASETFERAKSEVISVLQNQIEERTDVFLESLKEEVERLSPLSPLEVAQHLSPKGQIMTRDTVVLGQGVQVPPHVCLIADVASIRHTFEICHSAGELVRLLRRRPRIWNVKRADAKP